MDENIGEGSQLLFVFKQLGQVVGNALSVVVLAHVSVVVFAVAFASKCSVKLVKPNFGALSLF